MKFSKLLIASAGLFLMLAGSMITKNIKRKRVQNCKKHYDDCTFKSVGSECCDGLYCDAYQFDVPKQGWVHMDPTNKNKGKCKLKQDQKCSTTDHEIHKTAPCVNHLICEYYALQSELGPHCIPRTNSPKLLD